MTTKPTIVVSGFGRCGTSMAMHMLHAGGIECVGPFPAYEIDQAKAPTEAFIRLCAGRAVKVLDPQRVGLPGDVRVIWMKRDEAEQAKSHGKFTGMNYSREQRRALARQFESDFSAVRRVIGKRPWLVLRFEDVLADPAYAAQQMAEFVAPVGPLDAAQAAGAVYRRSPQCAPGLHLELALIEAAQ